MPKKGQKGHKLSLETRLKMSLAHTGVPKPHLRKCPKQRILNNVEKPDGDTGCWLWKGSKFAKTGYGQIEVNGGPKRAHRVSYEMFTGPIPEGLKVLHKCDVRHCVNPDHLFVGTQQDNVDDMRKKGRENYPKGERIGVAKMTEDTVRLARKLHSEQGYSVARLCRMFWLTRVPMNCLLTRQTWKHVT